MDYHVNSQCRTLWKVLFRSEHSRILRPYLESAAAAAVAQQFSPPLASILNKQNARKGFEPVGRGFESLRARTVKILRDGFSKDRPFFFWGSRCRWGYVGATIEINEGEGDITRCQPS